MEVKHPKIPLVVIVGPTASGKTLLAVNVAKKCNGEIICADSRSIYKGADIGTAKPTIKERSSIPHWGLDLVEPGEYFSVADFKKYADEKINEIRARGKVPILVGGTGLYIDSVVFDYKFGPKRNVILRTKLQHMTLDELLIYCKKNKISLPENLRNKRYITRAIEMNGVVPTKKLKPIKSTIIVGITTEKDILRSRIIQRAEQMFDDGVIGEAKMIGDRFGWASEAMKSNIYPLVHSLLDGEITQEGLKARFVTLDWRLAKRQLTWLRRNRFIQWFSLNDAEYYLNDKLAIFEEP
jgi:tRNA dimethylallyltransferase